MAQNKNESPFDAQLRRIRQITGARTQAELADFLGIQQASVSDARRRGKIPRSWLLALERLLSVRPEWIETGAGPYCLSTLPETTEAAALLRHLPARLLAEELLRRIAIAQSDAVYILDEPGA